MKNIKLCIAYDGTRYNGWQKQGNTSNTVQGKLEELLSRMTGEHIEVCGSGRTDAGVHAKGQIANFQTESSMTAEQMKDYMETYLPKDIAVISIEEVKARFHARLLAKEKIYSYTIWNSGVSNVFERKYMYQIKDPLNIEAMEKGAEYFIGEHDFKSFCSLKKYKKSTIRIIREIKIQKDGPRIVITFRGDGFLYHMVRIMTGTLIEIGLGSRDPKEIASLLMSADRTKAGFTAPPLGLCLEQVVY